MTQNSIIYKIRRQVGSAVLVHFDDMIAETARILAGHMAHAVTH